MSRRKERVHGLAHVLWVQCPEGHQVGMVALQRPGTRPGRSPFKIGLPLERIDGPAGETKVLAICPTCRRAGSKARPQILWDRLEKMLLVMERAGEIRGTIRTE